jgi:hypothetical protein
LKIYVCPFVHFWPLYYLSFELLLLIAFLCISKLFSLCSINESIIVTTTYRKHQQVHNNYTLETKVWNKIQNNYTLWKLSQERQFRKITLRKLILQHWNTIGGYGV